jgi:hypothetical protein
MQLNEHATLKKLAMRPFKEKRIASALKKCVKKLSAKSSADLSQLKMLAYALYVHGYENEALAAAQVIDGEEFRGDFQIWTPIEKILLLQMWIYHNSGKTAEADAVLKKIAEPMRDHEEALRRRLSFEWLSDAVIARYEKAGDLKTANNSRFSDLGDLLFIWALGKGRKDLEEKTVDIVGAEKRFREYIRILQNAG